MSFVLFCYRLLALVVSLLLVWCSGRHVDAFLTLEVFIIERWVDIVHKKNRYKIPGCCLVICIVIILACACSSTGENQTDHTELAAAGRSVSILSAEGNDVFMTRSTDREIAASAGMVLFDGYAVTTGADSKCILILDDGSLLTMDQNSKISISRTWRGRFSVSVLSGGILVDAATQQSDRIVETSVGNSAISIRGRRAVRRQSRDKRAYAETEALFANHGVRL